MRRNTVLATLGALLIAMILPGPTMATYPDRNGRMLFQADTGSGYQLYTIKANGHDLRQVTHVTNSDAVLGDWSPDGTQIVYEHGAEAFARVEIMNADGTNVRVLAGTGTETGVTFAGDPSFTPDGEHIVFNKFVAATEDFGIWIMNLDGSGQHEIGDLPYGDPNVSPDGDTLLMLGSKDDDERQQALFTASVSGGAVQRITSFALDAAGKSDWAPDRRRVTTSDNANIPELSANVVRCRPTAASRSMSPSTATPPFEHTSAATRRMATGSCSASKTTDSTPSAWCVLTARGCARSCPSRTSGPEGSTGVRRH